MLQVVQTAEQEFTTVVNKSINRKTIFISRDLSQNSSFLSTLVTSGHEVVSGSLINITPIRFTHTPQTKWIFFSSKNAIKHFLEQAPVSDPDTMFGVMGKSSAKFLSSYGIQAHFTGEGTDVRKIGKDFAAILGNDSVLFPQAIDSLQSIQKEISFTNICYNLYVYKTSPKTDFIVPPADVLVFTSPSNVAAYTSKYQIRGGQKVIAIGTSTMSRLKECGTRNVIAASSFTEEGLAEAVLGSIG